MFLSTVLGLNFDMCIICIWIKKLFLLRNCSKSSEMSQNHIHLTLISNHGVLFCCICYPYECNYINPCVNYKKLYSELMLLIKQGRSKLDNWGEADTHIFVFTHHKRQLISKEINRADPPPPRQLSSLLRPCNGMETQHYHHRIIRWTYS